MSNFDDLIRRKYQDASQKTPVHLWDGIEKALDKDEKKPKIAYWRLLALSLACSSALAGFYYFSTIHKAELSEQNKSAVTSIVLNENEPIEAKKQIEVNRRTEEKVKNEEVPVVTLKKDESEVFTTSDNKVNLNQFVVLGTKASPIVLTLKHEQRENTEPPGAITEKTSEAQDNASLFPLIPSSETLSELPNTLKPLPYSFLRFGKKKKSECFDFSKNTRTSFFVELDGGYIAASRKFTPRNNESNTALDLRNNTETLLPGFQSALLIGIKLQDRFTIKTGLNYRRWRYRFNWTQGNYMKTTIITQPDGSTTTTTETGTIRVQQYNRLNHFEIPLLVGFEQRFGKLYFNLSGGAALRWMNEVNGKILFPSQQIVNLNETNDVYHNSASLALIGELQAGYSLTEHFDLYLLGNYYQGLPGWTDTNYTLEEKWSGIGAKFGLRYNF